MFHKRRGCAGALADLSLVFADADALPGELTYRIAANNQPGLVSAFIENGQLLIALNPSAYGSAIVSVQASDAAGGTVTDQVVLNVLGFDTTAPTSSVGPLPSLLTSLDIPITVSGSDANVPGAITSGIASYDLYVSVDGAASVKFATVPASLPLTQFRAQSNHHYFFYSRARDTAGNTQDTPTAGIQHIYVGDLEAPDSQVESAVAGSDGIFTVNMRGSDRGLGGLQRFDLYVSIDDGTATLVDSVAPGAADAAGIYRASTKYQGRLDNQSHTYRFFTIARDGAGNVEAPPPRNSDVLVTSTFSTQGLRATGIDVQAGEKQRSYIRSVDVLFSSENGLADLLPLNPIEIYRYDLNATDLSRAAGTQVTGGSTTRVADRLRIDWGTGGITGNRSTNAGDGLYRVFVDGNGDGDYDDSSDAIFEFARILGDTNGDAIVDGLDSAIVQAQQGRTGLGLNGDVDGSGAVNATDKLRVNAQQGRALSRPTESVA